MTRYAARLPGVRRPATPRSGASLAVVLAALVLIECVVIGTLHLAMLERQLAAGAVETLRFRLAADAALARAALAWPGAAETLPADNGSLAVLDDASPDGLMLQATLQRIAPALYLLRASASRPAPRHGLASAELLLLRPVLPADFDPAEWTDPVSTTAGSRADSLLHRIMGELPYLKADSRVVTLEAGAIIEGAIEGVVVAAGDLSITAGGRLVGMLFVAGTLHVEDGVELVGAVIARSFQDDAPGFEPLADAAEQAVDRAGLRRPRPVPGRARIPGF